MFYYQSGILSWVKDVCFDASCPIFCGVNEATQFIGMLPDDVPIWQLQAEGLDDTIVLIVGAGLDS